MINETENLNSTERRNFLKLMGVGGFTAAMVAGGAGMLWSSAAAAQTANEERDREKAAEHVMTIATAYVLGASRSGFYEWLHKPLSDRAIEDQRLLVLIRASHAASGAVYGARRVFLDLREAGETCGRHRIARIMRMSKVKALHGYKVPRGMVGRPSIIGLVRPLSGTG